MSWFEDLFKGSHTGTLIGAGLGALAGGSSKGEEVSATKQLDPRIGRYVYGADGNGGLLADVQSIYSQQMQNGGLNDLQRQGLGMRTQYLQSPQYQNSYQAMMNQGMGLMGAGIAGNPFTRSQQRPQATAMGQGGFQYSPVQAQAPMYRPAPQQAPAQQTAPQQSAPVQKSSQGSGFTIGGSGGGSSNPGGQGISNNVAGAALAAMAASENPAIRALFPSVAAMLGVAGSAVAGQQADAMGAAGNKLAASQPLANLGIGTVSDADGNVRTVSTPSLISAADRAMFGDPEGDGPQQSSGGASGSGYGNYSFGNRSGGNIGSMGWGQGVSGTANGGLSGGFQGGGGLGIRGSW